MTTSLVWPGGGQGELLAVVPANGDVRGGGRLEAVQAQERLHKVIDGRADGRAPALSGPERRQQFEREGRWADWIRNDAGDVSDWHHHAANQTYVYISRGSVTIEFGLGGAESVVARAGDFFIVPSQTIHRETTGQDIDLEAFIIRVGGVPEHVTVDGPEASGG